jgi:thymidine kinase
MIINFISGVMGAGKSAQLIEDVTFYKKQRGLKVAPVKISLKKQDKHGTITSRNGTSTDCLVLNVEQTDFEMLASLSIYIHDIGDVDYLLIDESQFLSAEQVNAIETAAQIFNTNIIFYGLMTDFTGRNFDGSEWIMEIADDVFILPAECESEACEKDAVFNARIINGEIATEGKRIVEDKDVYKSLCPACYKELQ